MSFIESISKLPLRIRALFPSRPNIPYLVIKGNINSQTTFQVSEKLRRLPRQTNKLAVVINSAGGQMAQALIIAQKLKAKAQQHNAELVTFAEQHALNSAFYLLSQGDKVYIDNTTFVGGLQIGVSKTNLGIFSDYINNVVYNEKSSYVAELKKNENISQQKANQMKQLFNSFSEDIKKRILTNRKKISAETDLTKYYYGEEALKLGLVDGVCRIQQCGAELGWPNIYPLRQNKMANLLRKISKN